MWWLVCNDVPSTSNRLSRVGMIGLLEDGATPNPLFVYKIFYILDNTSARVNLERHSKKRKHILVHYYYQSWSHFILKF